MMIILKALTFKALYDGHLEGATKRERNVIDRGRKDDKNTHC
jgi:hypothetical protein